MVFFRNQLIWKRGIRDAQFPRIFSFFVVEVLVIAIKWNPDIKGIKVNDSELKVFMLADAKTCFVEGSKKPFENLFATLEIFGKFSGCKTNMSKSELSLLGLVLRKVLKIFHTRIKDWNGSLMMVSYFPLNSNALFYLNF